jgi:RHS repeat-associated protein
MGNPKSDGKEIKTTTARSPADGTSKNAPTQTTNAAVGGGGAGTANPNDKNEDSKDKCELDPIAVAKGAVVEAWLDVSLPGLVPFQLRRRYSSANFAVSTPLGRGGWTHDYHQWIEPEGKGFLLRNYEGVDLPFGSIPGRGDALHRGRRLLLRRIDERFELLHLGSRVTRVYAPSHPGGRAWLRSIADSRGNRLSFHYEGERLARVTDTAGREIHLRSDAEGRIVAVDMAVNRRIHRVFSYGYTDAGELAFAADGLGHALRYAYDGKHRVVQKWLRNGFSVRYEYDPHHGRVTRTRGDDDFFRAELTYDFDKRTTTVHGGAQPRVYSWDAAGNVVREETFDGRHVRERDWDKDQLLLSEKDAAGREHRYAYDARGAVTEHVDPAGNVTKYEHVDDLLRRVVQPNGSVVVHEYTGYGELWGFTIETGARYSFDRDEKGRVTALYGPEGLLERLEYDAHHNLVRSTGALGQTTVYEYDDLGRPTLRRDPLGGVTRVEYDAAGRITAVTYPDGSRSAYELDGAGQTTRVQAPGGDIRMEYVGTGVLARAVMEDGGEWRIAYDRAQKPVRILNPKGEQYEIRYDRAGRVIEERTFDGRTIRYTYDLSGLLHRIERPDGTWREFAYDPLGNVVLDASPHGPITFTRDSEGYLLKATLEEDLLVTSVVFERDALGRVVAETQDGQTIKYAYDAAERLAARTLPTGEITRFRYDLSGKLAKIEHGAQVIAITRDAAGQERERRLLGSPVAIASSYDGMGRLAAQAAVPAQPESAALVRGLLLRRWTYDAAGRPQTIDDARWGCTEYAYDKAHNLIRARRGSIEAAFEYDPAGGLVRALRGLLAPGDRWAVREGDVLARTDRAAYEYDACRRRTKRIELEGGKPTGRVTEYVWDCRDRLREVRLPGGEVVRYFYDALGRRTRKVVFPQKPEDPLEAPPPPRVVRFLWEGDVLAAEMDTERGGRAYVHEPGTYLPILQLEQGQLFLYVLDQVGAPRELLDAEGRVVWAAAFDPWGRVVDVQRDPPAARARPVETPFRLLGQYADEETGLHCTRFRYWDPEVARWCSADPLEIDGGARLFGLDGSPTEAVDPLGLDIYFIGENQPRVEKVARAMGGKTILKEWPRELFFRPYVKELHEAVSVEFNREWIRKKIEEGHDIRDIGRDPKAVAAGKEISPFYQAELEEIKKASEAGKLKGGQYVKMKLKKEPPDCG